MQDVPFATSPNVLMSPADSCSEPFSPASGSLYSHSPVLPYDRMSDFRAHRVPPIQPPSGMSPTMQSQGTSVAGSSGMMGRGDSCPGAYTLHRGTFPSLSGLNDMSRMSTYTSTPRALDSTIDRSQSMMFGQSGNILMEPVQRLSQPMTDAPPFHETDIIHPVFAGSISGQAIKPEIQAKIHKGFFQVDDKWTCYRRNYFSVSCSFSLHPWTNTPLFLKFTDHPAGDRIRAFSMSISAIVNSQFAEPRELVQHTPKRDKQSESKPKKVVLQPCQPPPLMLGHGSASNGNHGFPLASQSAGMPMDYHSSFSSTAQASQPPTQYTFERIQFQKATANNGKRRAQQQYYNLVVELYADITPVGSSEQRLVKIARRLSHPMVVRGRSPGHYKDGRRDSSTSMGPDSGSGGSGDSSGGAVLPPGIGHASRPHLGLMSYDHSQRGGAHYGRPDYHQMATADHSPLSDSPHVSSSSSSAFDIGMLDDSMDPMNTMKCTSSMGSYPDSTYAITSPGHRKTEGPFRHHLPPFEYDTLSKGSDDSGNSYPDSFDSMVSMLPSDQNDHSLFLKHPRMTLHHSSTTGYDPFYPSRPSDPGPYGRFDPVQHSHGLVA
ncbi:hypothetical protein ASPWEDRAFT_45103 [Aspergillus wentii DTO 134E9]|uniref:NDT80 domain-containing protein n=1 Tax=Aspergillus wentii DTO 134E9 TaxID=1073089 RepID=A0A1L9R8D5_ASPWE|nr:uncharacterized protein ASPWEDRAFT_45103 [Aspergillus wentii DTO 134E9]OJJ31143.1 hypothetical protein ASPWEDRAFT_45103 [Aspergillus wentii DTO 134E9]